LLLNFSGHSNLAVVNHSRHNWRLDTQRQDAADKGQVNSFPEASRNFHICFLESSVMTGVTSSGSGDICRFCYLRQALPA
jgi:hypothetical protein